MDVLEIAVVGAGRMGGAHIRALADSTTVRVVATSDPDPGIRERLAATGLRTHATLADLIEAGGFDAALVASPTGTHLDAVGALAAAGLPVLCEKPCGRNVDEAGEARRAAAKAGVPLQIGYWRRFLPSLRALREDIRGGSFGRVQWVHCFQWDEFPPSPAFRLGSGGILIDMAVHELDMTRWLTGDEVVRAVGIAASTGSEPPIQGDPESVSFLARLGEGGLLSATLGRRFPPGDACRVQVIGSDRAADVPYLWPPQGERVFQDALRAQAEGFAAWVRGGPPEGATADDAVEALAGVEMVIREIDLTDAAR